MKQKRKIIRKYSIEDLNRLVFSILSGTDDTEEDLSLRVGRNKGYITQSRSRNQISEKLMFLLQQEMDKKTAKSMPDMTVSEITTLRASIKALSMFVAMLSSKTQGRRVEEILDELEQTTRVLLRDMLKVWLVFFSFSS